MTIKKNKLDLSNRPVLSFKTTLPHFRQQRYFEMGDISFYK